MSFEKIINDFNEQMNVEFESAYLYLSMSIFFETRSLSGFSNWMKHQYDEEREHAMKFFDYILERGGKPELGSFEKPKKDWETTLEIFEETLKHEKMITSRIYNLMDLVINEKDYASKVFLDWFIAEQVEEESTVNGILDQLRMIKDNPSALFFLDKELEKRDNISE